MLKHNQLKIETWSERGHTHTHTLTCAPALAGPWHLCVVSETVPPGSDSQMWFKVLHQVCSPLQPIITCNFMYIIAHTDILVITILYLTHCVVLTNTSNSLYCLHAACLFCVWAHGPTACCTSHQYNVCEVCSYMGEQVCVCLHAHKLTSQYRVKPGKSVKSLT